MVEKVLLLISIVSVGAIGEEDKQGRRKRWTRLVDAGGNRGVQGGDSALWRTKPWMVFCYCSGKNIMNSEIFYFLYFLFFSLFSFDFFF